MNMQLVKRTGGKYEPMPIGNRILGQNIIDLEDGLYIARKGKGFHKIRVVHQHNCMNIRMVNIRYYFDLRPENRGKFSMMLKVGSIGMSQERLNERFEENHDKLESFMHIIDTYTNFERIGD